MRECVNRRLSSVIWAWRRPRCVLGVMAVLVGVLTLACSTGSYPYDFFHEMHYNQSYKSQEPPRLDVPADGSVPVLTPTPDKNGGELYAVNCVMCHGQDMKGNGPVLRIMKDTYGYTPILDPDLTSNMAQGQTDQQLFGLIAGGVVVMPSFKKLLTTDEIHLIVEYLRENVGAQQPITSLTPTPTPKAAPSNPTPTTVRPSTDAELGMQVFTNLAEPSCGICHTIDGLSTAAVGPDLTHIGTGAATRVDGKTAEQYVRQSIIDPGAFIVPEFTNVMPPGYEQSLTPEQLDGLVAFLLTQK